MVKINYVSWGVGNLIDGEIYIHEALRQFPELEKKVILHELNHYNGEKWVDWNEPFDWDMVRFCLEHPSTWWQWVPIWIDGNKITISRNVLLWWLLVLGCIFLLVGEYYLWLK